MSAKQKSARIVIVDLADIVQRIFSDVGSKHLLHIVIGRQHDVTRVEPDHIGRPTIVIRGCKQRCIASHLDDVGITFATRQECRFGECGTQVIITVQTPSSV